MDAPGSPPRFGSAVLTVVLSCDLRWRRYRAVGAAAIHGVFFHDVLLEDRSLSAATYVAGLTPHGPLDAPPEALRRTCSILEGAAWVDEPSPHLARAALGAGELPLWNPRHGPRRAARRQLELGRRQSATVVADSLADAGGRRPLLPRTRCCCWRATWLFLGVFGVALDRWRSSGAAVVAYGGYAMAWIVHHPLSSEIFLPLLLLGFERGRRGRPSGWIVLALAAAGSLLGGKLQATSLCFAFFGVCVVERAPRRSGGAGAWTLAARSVGLWHARRRRGISLVPALELMARASGLTLGGPLAARQLHGAVAVAREPGAAAPLRRARARASPTGS